MTPGLSMFAERTATASVSPAARVGADAPLLAGGTTFRDYMLDDTGAVTVQPRVEAAVVGAPYGAQWERTQAEAAATQRRLLWIGGAVAFVLVLAAIGLTWTRK